MQEVINLAKSGDYEKVKLRIKKDPALANAKEKEAKKTPLITIILRNEREKSYNEVKSMIDFLIDHNVDCGEKSCDQEHLLPLHHACSLGHPEIIKKIALQNKSRIFYSDFKVLPPLVFFLILNKDKLENESIVDIFKFFLENCTNRKIKLNTITYFGSTLAHVIASYGNPEFLKILESYGLASLFEEKDDNLWLPIHEAAHTGNLETFKYLFSKNESHLSVLNANKDNAALIAAKHCFFNIIKFIFEKDKKTLAIRNAFNENILHKIFQSKSQKMQKTLSFLAAQYPELIRIIIYLPDSKNLTPISIIMDNDWLALFEIIDALNIPHALAAPDIVNPIDKGKPFWTTLTHLAVEGQASRILEHLHQKDPLSLEHTDTAGFTPLHRAANYNHPEMISIILDLHPTAIAQKVVLPQKTQESDDTDHNAIDIAIYAASYKSLSSLLEYGAKNKLKISYKSWAHITQQEDWISIGLLILAGYKISDLPLLCSLAPKIENFFKQALEKLNPILKHLFEQSANFIGCILTQMWKNYQSQQEPIKTYAIDNSKRETDRNPKSPIAFELLSYILYQKFFDEFISKLKKEYFNADFSCVTQSFFTTCILSPMEKFTEEFNKKLAKKCEPSSKKPMAETKFDFPLFVNPPKNKSIEEEKQNQSSQYSHHNQPAK